MSCMIFTFTRLLSVSLPCKFLYKEYAPFVGLCNALCALHTHKSNVEYGDYVPIGFWASDLGTFPERTILMNSWVCCFAYICAI